MCGNRFNSLSFSVTIDCDSGDTYDSGESVDSDESVFSGYSGDSGEFV